MFDVDQLRDYIIRPALEGIGRWSRPAESLLLLTAATESHLGTYVHQLGRGPALGIYQMEPATHGDIWENYLRYKPDLSSAICDVCGIAPDQCLADRMVWDLRYATCMARCHYLRVRSTIPLAADWVALAKYWKDHYNTHLGAGTPEHAIAACKSCGVTT